MKHTYASTSNEKLNIPMTAEEWDVVSFVAFENETSTIYPFATEFDNLTMDMVDKIVEECNGHSDDTEILYEVCERILGINQVLIK